MKDITKTKAHADFLRRGFYYSSEGSKHTYEDKCCYESYYFCITFDLEKMEHQDNFYRDEWYYLGTLINDMKKELGWVE